MIPFWQLQFCLFLLLIELLILHVIQSKNFYRESCQPLWSLFVFIPMLFFLYSMPDTTWFIKSVALFGFVHFTGAVMFLFEGEFGNILHTGDCRLTTDCLQYLPIKYISKKGRETLCQLDYIFLDCTFGRCSFKFPSKQSAIQQVLYSYSIIFLQYFDVFLQHHQSPSWLQFNNHRWLIAYGSIHMHHLFILHVIFLARKRYLLKYLEHLDQKYLLTRQTIQIVFTLFFMLHQKSFHKMLLLAFRYVLHY